MANSCVDDSNVAFWKTKFESCNKNFLALKSLTNKAVTDYEELRTKHDQLNKQHVELKTKFVTTETRLHQLEAAFEPACEEFQDLQKKYDIERTCRTEAETYASKCHHQNVKLKRQSQLLLEKFETVDISIEDILKASQDDEEVVDSPFTSKRNTLNAKIQVLETEVKQLEVRLSDSISCEQIWNDKCCQLELKLNIALQDVENYKQQIENVKQVSDLAWTDYEELQQKYNRVVYLNQEAIGYAHKMLAEREAVMRESSVLLASAATDERLMKSLHEIEELTKTLQEEKEFHQKKILQLEEAIAEYENSEKVDGEEKQLKLVLSQMECLQKSYNELEKWKIKLEKENIDLVNRLDVAEQKLRPPPPPPPPPPPMLFRPFQIFMKKKPSQLNKENDPKKEAYADAIQEMMKRIKQGQTLKPVHQTQERPGIDTSTPSPMENLQNVLKSMKRVPKPDVADSKPTDVSDVKINPAYNLRPVAKDQRTLVKDRCGPSFDSAGVGNVDRRRLGSLGQSKSVDSDHYLHPVDVDKHNSSDDKDEVTSSGDTSNRGCLQRNEGTDM